jgi:transcription termination factor Rho
MASGAGREARRRGSKLSRTRRRGYPAAAVAETLDELHLADLHALAARLGVPRFRLLRREELVSEIEARNGGGEVAAAEPEVAPEPELEREPERGPEAERERERPAEPAAEAVSGVLEITSQGYGFLRLHGLDPGPDDVYVSASQVRRLELRAGDEVAGPARSPRRGERHRALVHVDQVNGAEPVAERPEFERLTPIVPTRRVPLDHDPGDVLTRAVDLLAPLAVGQRVLITAAPRSGRTMLLRGLASAIGAVEGCEMIVLLIDERPEEATAWRAALPDAEIASATAELAPEEQVRAAELALERARRHAEAGRDAVLIVDSLSRLAVAADRVIEAKRLFGSGRELAEDGAGSVTVIATVVAGADDGGAAERAVMTTESSLIALDPELAAAGVIPALRAGDCRVSNEDELRGPDELSAVRRLRSLLASVDPPAAADLLRERIEGAPTNRELLQSL